MIKRILYFSLIFSLCCLTNCKDDTDQVTQAEVVILKNDGFQAGQSVQFQVGNKIGDQMASRLGPINETFSVKKVHLFWGGKDENEDFMLRIYQDNGTVDPGPELFSKQISLPANDTELQTIDLSREGIRVMGGGTIRVSVEMQSDGAPSIAKDEGSTRVNEKNFAKRKDGSWTLMDDSNLMGNWIIRAEIVKEI